MLTDLRLLVIEMFGLVATRYELFRSLDLQDIKGIQIHDSLVKTTVLINHGSKGATGETELYNLTVHRNAPVQGSLNFTATAKTLEHAEQFRNIITSASKFRSDEVAKQNQKRIILDFGDLASQLAKGGIVVQVVRCPACGASMNLPTEGEAGHMSILPNHLNRCRPVQKDPGELVRDAKMRRRTGRPT